MKIIKVNGKDYRSLNKGEEHSGPFFMNIAGNAVEFTYHRTWYSSWDGVAEFDTTKLRNNPKTRHWADALHNGVSDPTHPAHFDTCRAYFIFDNQVLVLHKYEDGLDNWE
jgi:hypothetical protein